MSCFHRQRQPDVPSVQLAVTPDWVSKVIALKTWIEKTIAYVTFRPKSSEFDEKITFYRNDTKTVRLRIPDTLKVLMNTLTHIHNHLQKHTHTTHAHSPTTHTYSPTTHTHLHTHTRTHTLTQRFGGKCKMGGWTFKWNMSLFNYRVGWKTVCGRGRSRGARSGISVSKSFRHRHCRDRAWVVHSCQSRSTSVVRKNGL